MNIVPYINNNNKNNEWTQHSNLNFKIFLIFKGKLNKNVLMCFYMKSESVHKNKLLQ